MPTCLSILGSNFALSLGSSFHAMTSSVMLYSSHAWQNEIYFSSNEVFEVSPDHFHSYLKVYLRYLAFAFKSLHYPWIPSFN